MREKECKTRVLLVRHGATDFPLDRVYCDEQEDPELNGAGLLQAEQAAEHLKGLRIDALYVSPCQRTQATARAIARRHQSLELITDDALRERHFGVWEGLYFSEIEARFTAEYGEWKQDQAAFRPSGGESVYDLAERVVPKLSEIVARHQGGVVAVVTHVGPIRVLVAQALGMPIESYRQIQIDTASITMVDYGSTQNNMILLNFHLRHWL